jgi:hypothetical protein
MSPNSIDLTWLNAVKRRAQAGLNNDPYRIDPIADDDEIQAAITGFSKHLLNYTGQASLNSVVTVIDEVYDGNGNQRMPTRSWPIKALRSVSANGAPIPVSTGPTVWGAYVDAGGHSIALRGGQGNFTTFPYPNYSTYGGTTKGPAFPRGVGNILLSLDVGYDPQTVTNEIDTILAQTISLQRAPWVADGGVLYYPTLLPLEQVDNTPGPGQYAVSEGLYVFNVADEGQQVAVTYDVNAAPSDLEYAVRCVVAINYKRKAWQDQKTRGVNAGTSSSTTSYQSWEWPPEYACVFEYYKRLASIS